MIPIMAPVPAKLVVSSLASMVLMATLVEHVGASLIALAASLPVAAAIADKNSEKTLDQLSALVSALTSSGLAGADQVSRQVVESRIRLRRVRKLLSAMALLTPAIVFLVGLPIGGWISGIAALLFFRIGLEGSRTLERATELKEQLERDVAAERKRREALRRLYPDEPLRVAQPS